MPWDRNLPAGYGYYHKTVDGSYTVLAGDDKMALIVTSSGTVTLPALSGLHDTYSVLIENDSPGAVLVVEAAADGAATLATLTAVDDYGIFLKRSSSLWSSALSIEPSSAGYTTYTVAIGAMPNATSKSTAHGIPSYDITKIRALYGMMYNGNRGLTLPWTQTAAAANQVSLEISSTNVVATDAADYSAWTGVAYVEVNS